MKGNSQSRKWQLTINNPLLVGIDLNVLREKVLNLNPDYVCYCEEVADTGTHHYHVFMYSHSPKRFSTIKNIFPTAHIEKAYASCKVNREYIQKSGKWEDDHKSHTKVDGTFHEIGMLPSERDEKHPELALLVERVKDGATTMEIIEEFPQYAMQSRNINDLRMKYCIENYAKQTRKVQVTYMHVSGQFDSMGYIYSLYDYQDVCRITNYRTGKGISFDNYISQPVLVFENYEGQIEIASMIAYLEDYPVMLPARYEDRIASYEKVYIISYVSLEKIYPSEKIRNIGIWQKFICMIDTVITVDEDGVIEEENLNDSKVRRRTENSVKK